MSAVNSPSAMQNGNYPGSHSSHMGPPSAHVSPYGQPSQQDPQPYSLPQLEKSHEAHSPAQFQQYSYDIQLRYPAPAPSFPAPSMAGRFEPPRDLPLPPLSNMAPSGGYGAPIEMDTTGQIPPPGVKPRVTATLWEDEGTLCFQVDVKGTCVARREDNHMINGTKLLNVVGMTRGRRDGILKSEKQKNVVKIGPMHLKGVWIPFERALEFANKEKITESLYPIFVHNIGALLHHPINNPNTNNPPHIGLLPYAMNSRQYPPSSQIPRSSQDFSPLPLPLPQLPQMLPPPGYDYRAQEQAQQRHEYDYRDHNGIGGDQRHQEEHEYRDGSGNGGGGGEQRHEYQNNGQHHGLSLDQRPNGNAHDQVQGQGLRNDALPHDPRIQSIYS